MVKDSDIVKILRQEEKLGKLRSNSSIKNQGLEIYKSIDENITDETTIKKENELLDYDGFDNNTIENDDKIFSDLMEIINFTERISTRLYGDLTKEEIIDIVIVGDVNKPFLTELIDKAEKKINKRIRYLTYLPGNFNPDDKEKMNYVLVWSN